MGCTKDYPNGRLTMSAIRVVGLDNPVGVYDDAD